MKANDERAATVCELKQFEKKSSIIMESELGSSNGILE